MSVLPSSAVDEDKQREILQNFERQSELIENNMSEQRARHEQEIRVRFVGRVASIMTELYFDVGQIGRKEAASTTRSSSQG